MYILYIVIYRWKYTHTHINWLIRLRMRLGLHSIDRDSDFLKLEEVLR